MSTEPNSTRFIACLECGGVVMATLMPLKDKKTQSNTSGKARFNVTYCRKCVPTFTIRRTNEPSHLGVVMSINKRMVKTWYMYRALARLMDEAIDVDGDDNETAPSTIKLISRDEFIHPGKKDTYALSSITIDASNPGEAVAQMCPYLLTGFF